MMSTRLTVELVPSSTWRQNVRAIVSYSEWRRLRTFVLARAGHRCEVCGRGGRLECHEVWAYDDESYVQRLASLVALCRACHEVKHIGLSGVRGRGDAALRHLAEVNGWSPGDAETYLEAAFELWHLRSAHDWQLDLSHLDDLLAEMQPEPA